VCREARLRGGEDFGEAHDASGKINRNLEKERGSIRKQKSFGVSRRGEKKKKKTSGLGKWSSV